MPKQSLNPIIATGTAANAFEPIEIEVYIEKITPVDTYTSLGTFSFVADTSEQAAEQIQTLLHSALMVEIAKSIPGTESDAFEVPSLSRKYKYRHRYFSEGEWSSWTESAPDFVVHGGQAFEEFNNGFNVAAAAGPVLLHLSGKLFAPYGASGFIYARAHATGDLSWSFEFFNYDGTSASTSTGTFTVSRAGAIVAIPMVYPDSGKSPLFSCTVTMAGQPKSINLVSDKEKRLNRYDLCYLSAGGGWAFLPCHGSLTNSIEVTQQIAEVSIPNNYHSLSNISQFNAWESKGVKKFTLATGYWPQSYLESVIQDFLLSRYRFIWNTSLSKWLPVLINTKSAVYHEDFQANLRSFAFEARYAFESNLPTQP